MSLNVLLTGFFLEFRERLLIFSFLFIFLEDASFFLEDASFLLEDAFFFLEDASFFLEDASLIAFSNVFFFKGCDSITNCFEGERHQTGWEMGTTGVHVSSTLLTCDASSRN